jgi:transcription antitermination factor NusG
MLVSASESARVWLLLRTKPKQERHAVAALVERDVEGYCPRVVEPRWHTRAPVGPVPLFPSYVFAYCEPRTHFAAANYCPGIIEVVRFGHQLAAVEEQFITSLREREGERGYLALREVRRPPRPGQRARILAGALAGYEGLVERYMPAQDRVRLLLLLVSGKRRVELDARHIRCA